jgi:uncharacterized protein YndB with AHSA1/START domain
MSCTDEVPSVEREIELPASPAEVWETLPSLLGDEVELAVEPGGRLHATGPDGERIGVVEEVAAPSRLSFWWVPVDGDDAPSMVELELDRIVGGTLLRVRETRFDAGVGVPADALGGDLRALARA